MQSPVAVRVEGVALSGELEREILNQTKELERFYTRIIACRVVVTTPHRRQRRGRLYHVRIDLTVPGEEIVVGHEPGLDHAHEDPRVAVHDAFRAARRRLQDYVRRARRYVKHHETVEPSPGTPGLPAASPPHVHGHRDVRIPAGEVELAGTLTVPGEARALVLFAHGTGSGRSSPRSTYVSGVLQSAHVATLLADLLSWEESRDPRRGTDAQRLSQRLLQIVHWVGHEPELRHLKLGLHGANTGAASTLVAAAGEPAIGAIVVRGGRPDQAGPALPFVAAPTLLIAGEEDAEGLAHAREALAALRCPRELVVVPGAGSLFDEIGALREAAQHARQWFMYHLLPPEA